MASIDLLPSGDGTTTGWTRFAASGTFAAKITDVPASHDGDTSYVQSPNLTSSSMFVLLDDVPGDFNPAGITSITLKAVAKKINTPQQAVDGSDIFVQIFRADESTAITEESAICEVTSTASYQSFERAVAVSGTHTVEDWNGARLRLRFVHTQNQMVDTTNQVRITAARATVVYDPAAEGTVVEPAPITLGLALLAPAVKVAVTPSVLTLGLRLLDAAVTLGSTFQVHFDPATGITVTNIEVVSDTEALVTIDIAADAPLTERMVTVETPEGVSNALPFTVILGTDTVAPAPLELGLRLVAPTLAVTVHPGTLALGFALQAPRLITQLRPGPLTLGLELRAPAAALTRLHPSPLTLGFTLQTPSVALGDVTVTPDTLTLGLVLPTPAVFASAALRPDPLVLGLALPAVTVTADVLLKPAPVTLGLALQPVTVTADVLVSPQPLVLGLQLPAVTVSLGTTTLTPDVLALGLALQQPAVLAHRRVEPSTLVLGLELQPAAVTADILVTPLPLQLGLQLLSPVLVVPAPPVTVRRRGPRQRLSYLPVTPRGVPGRR